jgi:hypothetical protein
MLNSYMQLSYLKLWAHILFNLTNVIYKFRIKILITLDNHNKDGY